MAEKAKTVIQNGVHNYSTEDAYIQPAPYIQQQLEGFKDLKLAFMVHWGLYNQLGILPSWGMVDAEARWARPENPYGDRSSWIPDGAKVREMYFDLIRSFNPVRFNPEEWADLAFEAGDAELYHMDPETGRQKVPVTYNSAEGTITFTGTGFSPYALVQTAGFYGRKALEQLPVLVQANASFFLSGSRGMKMLRKHQIHLLGSDCHNMSERKPNLGPALERIREKLGQEAVRWIQHNGSMALASRTGPDEIE